MKRYARTDSLLTVEGICPVRTTDQKVGGFEVPSGAQKIKAVTSRNAGYGLDSFPETAAIFHMLGAWCSVGAPLFRGGSCWRVLTSAFACRWIWIMTRPSCRCCLLWPLPWISATGQIRREWPMPTCDGQIQQQDRRAPGITAATAHYLICALRTPLGSSTTRTPQDQGIVVGRRTSGATLWPIPRCPATQKDRCRRRLLARVQAR
jgi:hypothetical protein